MSIPYPLAVIINLAEAVQGEIGRLPCNVTPPDTEDKIILVIWYKEGYTTPIYRYFLEVDSLHIIFVNKNLVSPPTPVSHILCGVAAPSVASFF